MSGDRLAGFRDTGGDPYATAPAPTTVANPEYHALPLSIKASYSLQEWLWLSDTQKATLEQRECEPEWNE